MDIRERRAKMLGWIGAVAFGICGLPQAVKAYKDGHTDGLDLMFLSLWTIGELFTLVAVIRDAAPAYMLVNYILNGMFLAVMWKYKLFPRKD